jgi:predicted nucleic acid-binding protein
VPIVVDASAALSAIMRETGPTAIRLTAELEREEWLAPALWWFEIRNGLIVNERRGRNSERLTAAALFELAQIDTAIDALPEGDSLMALARKHRLTVYDASYLELAMRRHLPLATLDVELIAAARAEGVPLVGESG